MFRSSHLIKTGLWSGKILLVAFFFLFICFFPGGALASPMTDSMLGYWKFDGNGNDSSGDGSTIVALNGASYNTSVPTTFFPNTRSLAFSSITSSATFANQSNLQPTSGLTISFWIKLDSPLPTTTQIAGNFAPIQNQGFFFEIGSSGYASFVVGNNGTAQKAISSIPLTINTWYHLVGKWDNTSGMARIYVDGVSAGSAGATMPPTYNSTNFKAGYFVGKMDDLRLYKRALTDGEIADLAAGSHTSASWTGSISSDYDYPGNWDISAVPDPYTLVTIKTATPQPSFLTSPESVADLTIESEATLNLLGKNLTINDNGTFSNNGTLSLYNTSTQVLNNFTNDTDSGTIVISGPSGANSPKTGYVYNNLTIDTTGTVLLAANLLVNGNLTLTSGMLSPTPTNFNLNLKGDWLKTGGTFSPNYSTVILSGTDQTISGSNNFYNLSKIVSAPDTLFFQDGHTQRVTHKLTLQGPVTSGQFLELRSDTTDSQWSINPTTACIIDISKLDIQDSHNSGTTIILPGRNIDSGNNTNWDFDDTAPSISLNTYPSDTANVHQPVTGTVSEIPKYTTTVSLVEYQMESTASAWSLCTANDGSFNEASENFTCTPSSALSDGVHIMYIRATDMNGNISSPTQADFTVDTIAPVISETTPVTTPTADASPDYTFNTDEAGTITYSGDCSANSTTAAVGDNTINFKTLPDGLHSNCTIQVDDAAGNASNFLSVTAFAIDTYPKISSISADGTSDGATISWTTNQVSTSKVDYGLTSGYGTSTTEADVITPVTSHKVDLSGLASCETYHYRVRSQDANTKETISDDYTFETAGCEETCPDGDPDEPGLDDADALDSSSIEISYTDSEEDVDHYELKYGTASGTYGWSLDDIGGKNEESYVIEELDPDTTYYFRIKAVNDCGESDWTSEVSATTDFEPSAPVDTGQTTMAETEQPVTDTAVPEAKNSLLEELPTYLKDDSQGHPQDPADFENAENSNIKPSDDLSVSNVEMVETSAGKRIKIGGKGPPNTILTVYIYSGDPIVVTVKTDSNGDWTYTVDKELEDGNHEVYVAVTNNTGAIKAKSEPLPFVKTAQAVRVASLVGGAKSSTQVWYKSGIFIYIIVAILGLILALISIGIYNRRISRKAENPSL